MLRRFPAVPAGVIAAATLMAGTQPAAAAAASPVSVPCSTTALASALAGAAGGETIRLAAGCDYVLTAALPPISTKLTIQGRGATLERSTAARTPGFAILTVNEGDLSVSNLTVRNGEGGIDFDETTNRNQTNNITVTRSTFTGNAGGGINLGGPDSSPGQATGTITGSTFTDNTGGGINDYGDSLTVTGSSFTGNTGGGLTTEEGEIAHHEVGAIAVTGSTFSGNSGGGVTCRGGEVCKVTVTCSVFSHNTGSGISAYNADGASISATHSVFRGNKSSYGGAIDMSAFVSGELTAADDTFTDNTATAGGGGIFNLESAALTGDIFTGNSATMGGAMENEWHATVTDTTFAGNKASEDGGAIYQTNPFGSGTLSITGGRITGNSASGDGGGIYNAGPPAGRASVSQSTTVSNNKPGNCAPLGSVVGCTG
jgi:predicted outer membrane repeat protein